jgi:palmitoyltransferase
MQTFPYFLRFIVYANLALWYLAGLLARRVAAVWADRHLPAYLGPSVSGLVGLTVLVLLNAATAFALGVMLYTSVKAWVFNTTLIEEWEMERHEAVLARVMEADEDGDGDEEEEDDGGRGTKAKGNFWGDDDVALRELMERIEFPYDLGVFANMAQAMGTKNPLRWFLPVFGGGPVINNDTPGKGSGWEWEENGFNDLPGLWPPSDPEKARRERQGGWPGAAAQQLEKRFEDYRTADEVKAAFARRQAEDFRRRQMAQAQTRQESKIIAELEEVDEFNTGAPSNRGEDYEWVGKPSWTNSEGDRLWDYGVDEDVDVEENFVNPPAGKDDDDVPLAELIRRRKVLTREEDG